MSTTVPERLTGGTLIERGVPDPNARLAGLRVLARLLDSAFVLPGTKFRIGLDPIIDLIPGVGDALGAVISSYILISAARIGVPKTVLARMLLNIGVDTVAGAVPVIGPVMDAAYRSNTRNIALLERAVADRTATRRASRWTLIALMAGVVAIVVGVVVGGFVLTIWLARLVWNNVG